MLWKKSEAFQLASLLIPFLDSDVALSVHITMPFKRFHHIQSSSDINLPSASAIDRYGKRRPIFDFGYFQEIKKIKNV